MSFKFKASESLQHGVRRILDEQLEKAIHELRSGDLEQHAAIHQVRKRFKKIRSLGRLIRYGLGDRYSEFNGWYRSAGQTLSSIRDAESIVAAVVRLSEQPENQHVQSGMRILKAALATRREQLIAEWKSLDDDLLKLAGALRQRRDELESWRLQGDDDVILWKGVENAYRRGRIALAVARETPSNEHWHDFRKRSKDHWYHQRLLVDVWPEMMEPREKFTSELCDRLGDDHDLAVLTTLLEDRLDSLLGAGDRAAVVEVIAERRKSLQKQAVAMGQCLFAEKKKAYRRRLAAYWTLWREETN